MSVALLVKEKSKSSAADNPNSQSFAVLEAVYMTGRTSLEELVRIFAPSVSMLHVDHQRIYKIYNDSVDLMMMTSKQVMCSPPCVSNFGLNAEFELDIGRYAHFSPLCSFL